MIPTNTPEFRKALLKGFPDVPSPLSEKDDFSSAKYDSIRIERTHAGTRMRIYFCWKTLDLFYFDTPYLYEDDRVTIADLKGKHPFKMT